MSKKTPKTNAPAPKLPKHAPTPARYRAASLYVRTRWSEKATIQNIAKELGVSVATVERWHRDDLAESKYTDADREKVQRLAEIGMPDDKIATVMGIGETTLKQNFRAELSEGRVRGDGAILTTLFDLATSGENHHTTVFLAKARLGMRDRDADTTAVQVNTTAPTEVHLGGRRLVAGDDGVTRLVRDE